MKIFIVSLEIKPECADEFIKLTRYNAENSVNEPGNIRFDLLRDEASPCSFKLYEAWEDDAAIAAHRETPHYKKWAEGIADMTAAPRSKTVNAPVWFTEK